MTFDRPFLQEVTSLDWGNYLLVRNVLQKTLKEIGVDNHHHNVVAACENGRKNTAVLLNGVFR